MEKYSVEYDEEKTKQGSISTKCPKCGAELSTQQILERHCPTCGTEPWEKQPPK